MTASIHDSAIFRDLMGDREVQALFTDTAELRAMLLVWGALAKAQAETGLIPDDAAAAIQRAALEIQIDPAAISAETGRNGVPVPALADRFRQEMAAPDAAHFVHFGATSQDIMDTGLALRLRQAVRLIEARLVRLLDVLGPLAAQESDTPMLGRTYGQAAVPTTFGAVVAGWGWPILEALTELEQLRPRVERVSLSGAAGTLSVMGADGPKIRAALAEGLGLGDPGRNWHSDRSGLAALSAWATRVCGILSKFGADLYILLRSECGEVSLRSGGSSSTMPQKSNPVGPSVLTAIAAQVTGLNSVIQSALVHREQRDGAAWISEWMALPQIVIGLGRATSLAGEIATGLEPDRARMRAAIESTDGRVFAEALSFRLARAMPRPDAQQTVKELCGEDRPLLEAATARFPDLDLGDVFDVTQALGHAPDDARAFAFAVAEMT